MKNKILGFISLFAVVAFLIVSCTKSPVEKSNEAYDWNKVIPEILSFNGPKSVAASGLVAVTYSVPARGGSSFKWVAVGYDADISVPDAHFPNIVDVTWHQSSVDTSALLICTETTHGGLSASDTLAVTLNRFCPWDITDFVGTWKGQRSLFREANGKIYDTVDITLEITADPDNETGLLIKAIDDPNTDGGEYLPQILKDVYTGWGERFQKNKGDEGNVYLNVGLLNGNITVKDAHWGQTLPGPYDYWCDGGGSWSGCTNNLSFTFNMYWASNKSDGYGSEISVSKQ